MTAQEWFAKGFEAYNTGDFEQAAEAYKQAIALQPDYADALTNLGITYKEQGQYEKAIKAYKTAIHYQPDYAHAYQNIGNVYYKQGQYQEWQKASEKVLEAIQGNAQQQEAAFSAQSQDERTKRLTNDESIAEALHRLARPARYPIARRTAGSV